MPLATKWQQKWIDLECHHQLLQKLGDESESFCTRWFKQSPGFRLLILVGKNGSGKTHTLERIAKFASASAMTVYHKAGGRLGRVPSVTVIRWPEACAQFGQKNYGVMDDAFDADLCCLDEAGGESDAWKENADRFCQILSRREGKFTVITTNVQPHNWAKSFDVRISDRLFRNSVIVDITAVPSYAMK